MKHCNICPIYHVIKAAKEERDPPKDKIVIRESSAEVDLQALMDGIASRIVKAKKKSHRHCSGRYFERIRSNFTMGL
jgi:hypothetical protein